RRNRAQLAIFRHDEWRRHGVFGRHAIYVADPSGVAHVRSFCADSNNVISRDDSGTGPHTDGRVAVAGGVVNERLKTSGRVAAAASASKERFKAISRVETA